MARNDYKLETSPGSYIGAFDIGTLKSPFTMLIQGPRGSKAEEALYNICQHLKATDGSQDFLFLTNSQYTLLGIDYQPCTSELLDAAIKGQQTLRREGKKKTLTVVLDGIVDLKKIDKQLTYLFANFRQIDTNLILTSQYCAGMSPAVRACLDYVMLFRTSNISELKRMYDYYGGCLGSFDVFQNVLRERLPEHSGLLLNNMNETQSYFLTEDVNPTKLTVFPRWSLRETPTSPVVPAELIYKIDRLDIAICEIIRQIADLRKELANVVSKV